MRLRRGDGRRRWVETTCSPTYDRDGLVASVVGIMRDSTEVEQREDKPRELADMNMPSDVSQLSTPEDATAGPLAEGGMQPPDANVVSGMGPLDQMLTTIERREIVSALKRAKGQRTLAARLLGISRSRLYRRMEALGIDPREVGSKLSI